MFELWNVVFFVILYSTNVNAAICKKPPIVLNGGIRLIQTQEQTEGSVAEVECRAGFLTADTFLRVYQVVCGSKGQWVMHKDGATPQPCSIKRCGSPPHVPDAKVIVNSVTEVIYSCYKGFRMLDPTSARLICSDGEWEGPTPTCEANQFCKPPGRPLNGKWTVLGKEEDEEYLPSNFVEFTASTEIKFSCDSGYKLVGPKIIKCMSSQEWSRGPPICIQESDRVWYCPDLGELKSDLCQCLGSSSKSLTWCQPFRRDTRVQCPCLGGGGVEVITCQQAASLDTGVWQYELPRCYKNNEFVPSSEIGGKAYSSADISVGKTQVSSVVIVVTTACSVLGVLVLIMVVVVFRRKKPRAPLFQQGPTPPPYSRVHNSSLDEHDRLALMAYADASGVPLPTYEEAIRPGGPLCMGPQGTAILPITLGHGGPDYRRLASVQPSVRMLNHTPMPNIAGDGNNNINNNNNNNSNRHSTVTTSTINTMSRDGVSEIFGSLDTVNVSMSDASTSITVETFDSGTSCRSMASSRANAGSLSSSDNHLASEDAPLLDAESQHDINVVSGGGHAGKEE